MSRLALFLVGVLVVPACGGGESSGVDADPSAPDASGNTGDGGPGGEFTELISRSFEIPAGTEYYRCTRRTVSEDLYISGFRAMSPLGTHHTVLSVNTSPTEPDGDFNCGAGDLEHSMLFASGVGTDDLFFPAGVAIRVPAGSQLSLNLHLYNVSNEPISGTAGTLVKTLPAAEVEQEAEFVFAGTAVIFLTDSTAPQTVKGGCAFDADQTVITVWPHMHQLGVHMKVTHEDNVIHDEPYSFNEQVNYNIAPLLVKAGERVEAECTYVNTTGQTVMFGDSSDAEMCFAGLYRYPSTNAGIFGCVPGGGFFP